MAAENCWHFFCAKSFNKRCFLEMVQHYYGAFLFVVTGDKQVLVLATASVDKKVKLWAAPSLNAS